MKVIFLDRDGVINEYPGDLKYVTAWSEFRFLPRVTDALKKLSSDEYRIFIISNQAGVSKGIYPQAQLDSITNNMLAEFKRSSVDIGGVYYCIHRKEDNCPCRKPKTGLLDSAINELKSDGLDIDFSGSFFVGDTIRDVETGKNAGLKTILVFSGKENPQNQDKWLPQPDFTAFDLYEAVDIILLHR